MMARALKDFEPRQGQLISDDFDPLAPWFAKPDSLALKESMSWDLDWDNMPDDVKAYRTRYLAYIAQMEENKKAMMK